MRTTTRWALGALLLAPSLAVAQTASDTAIQVRFGGFIDAYYAYDFGRPLTFDRSFASGAAFTTQPARHDEFNVNLAYMEANLAGKRLHGRLALQAGTSVQSNYAAEPAKGSVSGASLARNIQEAWAGYQVASTLWIDGGIFYSNLGDEQWASKDNPTYTRSLVADYSPYYSSGVRAVWQATRKLAVRLDVVNGWQNVSETNTDKGAGLRLDLAASPATTLSYYDLVNDEVGGRLRVFNGVAARSVFGGTTLLGQFDYGTLGAPSAGGGSSTWWGFTAVARQRVSPSVAISGRVERYMDPDQVNIVTGMTDPFLGDGASLGVDVVPQPRLMWRIEARGFMTEHGIFPDRDKAPAKNGGFVVTSMSLAF